MGGLQFADNRYAFISRSLRKTVRRTDLHPCAACEPGAPSRRDSDHRATPRPLLRPPDAVSATTQSRIYAENLDPGLRPIRRAAISGASRAGSRSERVACVDPLTNPRC